jgi:predicted secreted Zn-dependent protease
VVTVKRDLDPELERRGLTATGSKAAKAEAIVRHVAEHLAIISQKKWTGKRKASKCRGPLVASLGKSHHLLRVRSGWRVLGFLESTVL